MTVHFETTNPLNRWGNTFQDVGWGQANVFTTINQETNYNTSVRFTGIIREGQTFNELNRILPDAEKSFPKENGDIVKLWNTSNLDSQGVGMLVIGENLVESVHLGEVQYTDTQGSGTVAVSNLVLGTSQTMKERLGCQHPCTVYGQEGFVFGFDAKRRAIWRYNNNGLTNLSEVYGCKKWIIDRLALEPYWWYGGWDNNRKEYYLGSVIIDYDYEDYAGHALIFRDEQGNEGFVSQLEALYMPERSAEFPNNIGSRYPAIFMMNSEKRTFYLCQNFWGNDISTALNGKTHLVDISAGTWAIDQEYQCPTTLPVYVTTILNAGARVQWEGFMISSTQGLMRPTTNINDVSKWQVLFFAEEESAGVYGNISPTPQGKPQKIGSLAQSGIMRNQEGQVMMGIPSARIDVNGNLRATTPYVDQDPDLSLDRQIRLQSAVLSAKIIFVPGRETYNKEIAARFYQRFLIFVLARLAPQRNLPA